MDDNDTIVMGPPPRHRRRLLILIAAALVAVLVGAAVAFVTFADFEEGEVGTGVEEALPVAPVGLEPVPLEWQPSEPEPEEAQPIPIDDAEQTGSGGSDPCPGLIADGLVVTPNPIRIIHGNKGYLDIRNCADGQREWTASTVTWVELSESQASLASGAVFRVLFTVDTSDLPTGAYGFVISVNDIDVPVSGTKLGGFVAPGVTPSPVPTVGGFIAPGLSPCAAKCITRAWLSTLPGRADVSLEVSTNTSARISVQVDRDAPAYSNGGDPYYTDPELQLSTEDYRREWTTELKPLLPDTAYHIVVAALDTLGGTSYETGTFRTPDVVDELAAAEPGGCALECVEFAQLQPLFDTADMRVEVGTLVPTTIQVLANGQAIAGTGEAFVTEWEATLTLEPGTSYEVVLRVTDEQGRTRQHSAVVDTPALESQTILVTFHQIYVHNDADNTAFNQKGELTFRFEVNGVYLPQLDTGERKVRAPETVSLGSGRAVLIEAAPDQLPIRVQGQERDWDPGFCSAGDGIRPEPDGRLDGGGCDFEWNTAIGTVDLHAVTEGDALPGCFGFPEGVQGDLCVVLTATGEDPTFDVYLTIDIAT